jgi:uncharacterized protein YciI
MEKQHFFLRLIPPRPSFPYDMSDSERALMLEHVSYMQQLFAQGRVVIYGPVLAKDDSFGMGVLEVADEADARQIMDADPTIVAGLNRYQIAPMRVGAARGV